MAVTESTLKARFPEFEAAATAMVEACIAEAELLVDREIFGNRGDMAVQYLAAHFIASNPKGRLVRLKKNQGPKTQYLMLYDRVKRSIGAGFRVI